MCELKRRNVVLKSRNTILLFVRVRASFGYNLVWCSCRFLQRNVHLAVRAGNLLANGVRGKFNATIASQTRHFQIPGFLKGYGCLAMRTGNPLAKEVGWKLDVSAARCAGYF